MWICIQGSHCSPALPACSLPDCFTHGMAPGENKFHQEEVQWLNQRDRFSRGDPGRTAMTEERIRVLQSRLSGGTRPPQTGDATPPPQTSGASTSPDGQYAVTALASAGGGQGDDIDLMTTDGKLVLSVASAAQY